MILFSNAIWQTVDKQLTVGRYCVYTIELAEPLDCLNELILIAKVERSAKLRRKVHQLSIDQYSLRRSRYNISLNVVERR